MVPIKIKTEGVNKTSSKNNDTLRKLWSIISSADL